MKPIRNLLLPAVVVCFSAVGFWARAQWESGRGNREALVAEVATRVKVLAFNTDKPVQNVRLVIDGKEAAADSFHSLQSGIKIGVVRHENDIEVYCEIDHMGGILKGSYREVPAANLMQPEFLGPGTNVSIKGWTQIYGLSQHYMGKTNLIYDLRVEIK